MKTKVKITGIVLILTGRFLVAQDLIFTNTGQVIEGNVIEINDNTIKYKKKENPNGPSYSIEKNKITKIKYSNNKEDVFTPSIPAPETSNEETEYAQFDSIILQKKNLVGYDVAQFVYVSIGLTYERFFGKNSNFSIRIPFSVGFKYIGNENNLIVYDNSTYTNTNYTQNDNYYIYQNGKLAGGSFEFNYYPFKSKRFSYFVGPYFEYGIFAYKVLKYVPYTAYNYNGDPYTDYKPEYSSLRYDGQHIAGGINNGFLFHFNTIFTLTGTFGLGLKKDETIIPRDKILTQAKINLIFGIRF